MLSPWELHSAIRASLSRVPRGVRGLRKSRPRAERASRKLLTIINGRGWGVKGVPYGCLLITFKWNQTQASEREWGEKHHSQEWILSAR